MERTGTILAPATALLLGQNTFLSTPVSKTLGLSFSLNGGGEKPRFTPTQNGRSCISLYLKIYVLRQQTWRKKTLDWKAEAWPEFNLLVISPWTNFQLLFVFLNIWNLPYFETIISDVFILQICPTFYSRDINLYLVFFFVFTSRKTSILAANTEFYFLQYLSSPKQYTSTV